MILPLAHRLKHLLRLPFTQCQEAGLASLSALILHHHMQTSRSATIPIVLTANKTASGVAVSISHDGGKTFGLPVSVTLNPTGKVFNDKPWIAVDQTTGKYSGSIYIVWSYDHNGDCGYSNNCSEELAFSRSTDG